MPSPFRIRPATPAEIPAITRIYRHAVLYGTASFEIDPPEKTEMHRRQQALLEHGFPYLVAEREGDIGGFAYAGPYRSRPAYRWSVEDSVYVAPEWQRRGVGRTLLAELIGEAERRGFRQMVAVIGDSAQHPSIALHAAAGFRHAGLLRAVGFKFGRWLDSVLMQRPLGPAAERAP